MSDTLYLMQQARYIDLDHAITISSLALLESKGLLGVGRASEILSQPVQDSERASIIDGR